MLQHGQLLWRQIARTLHVTQSQWQQNYYEVLGLAKGTTQTEIKAAYYKLSMAYHPDRNKGCEDAAKRFREITQAYEILGNYRLRRLYDKGIVHTAGPQYTQHDRDIYDAPEEDDPETKFYKSRFKKSQVADSDGRTPIYNFDEWSRAHYGKSFERRQAAQEKHERKIRQTEISRVSGQNDMVMFAFIFAGLAVYLLFVAETSYDTPAQKADVRYKQEKAKLPMDAIPKTVPSKGDAV